MEEIVHGIKVDYSRDALFDELGRLRLKESYMKDDEVSPQERFAYVSSIFGSNPEHAQRLYNYSSNHWLSYSTPILSFGRSKRGLPISCFLNYIEDTAEGLVENLSETNWLSMLGGGVGIGFGIRSADDKSTGVMPHLKMYDASSLAYRQGRTRRGSYAAYLDISHPDIISFLEMRKPTGDQNMRTLNMHHGINIPDAFMEIIERCMLDPEADDSWELIDPHSNEHRETVSAKELWQRILEMRMMTGEPYIHFIDESNRKLPQWLKDKGLKVHQSNLCSEIILPTNEQRTAVCCLSSLNLEYYDEWKNDLLFLRDIAEMLDNVLEYFILHAPTTIERARYSASRERSIGIGALGWHAYLQRNNLPWESSIAVGRNKQIFKSIREKLDEANQQLGLERGEAPDAVGTGNRFSHLMAIAPNASSSILMGNTSPSIEPYRANAYRQDTLSGSHLNKNKYLDKVVNDYVATNPKADAQEIWSSIIANDGSVQHLDWMEEWTKDVFKTSMEIDQRWVVQHAADRQVFIDQAQSLNVFFRPDSHIKYIHAVHFQAWKQGLKTMYYCRSDKIAKADKVSKRIEREVIKEIDLHALAEGNDCLACEG
ncbi:NrdA Ribonucleotide reductase, alpha subunit [uncultured Caudovirales phage]|uniref:Ribonucleoside-diphosphate reductase n=1 Tax=uncultured Caudovirales phage TaxID=2100421 RepID=A0A6J7WWE8_9CAUD|nr:NrdA Ribonucleotide reductase, alpha subunit [uncultured Caudovirales phage]